MTEPIEPCPNCGGEANISSTFGGFVHCPGNRCFMTGPNDDPDGAKWNAMARAVREAADWRQRAEAAEAEVGRLRGLIEAHNAKFTSDCDKRTFGGFETCTWGFMPKDDSGWTCPTCPRRYLIDLPAEPASGGRNG